jgi:O-antigen/teichoic acid export membrane protein
MARVLFILLGCLFFGGALLIFLPAETAQTMTQILGLLFWVVVALWWWGRSKKKKNETTTFKTDVEPLEFFYDICLQALEDKKFQATKPDKFKAGARLTPT